jgi:cell filamentation protein
MRKPITRYSIGTSDENSFEPKSGNRVLKNLHGIKSKRAIDVLEFEALLRVQKEAIQTIREDQTITVAMIRELHRSVFSGLYSWAGEYRSVEVSKGSFAWPPSKYITQNLEELDRKLSTYTPCQGSLRAVARKMAEIHGDLLLIHPFRDGNGRIARLVAMLMALQAGYAPPDYRFTGKGSVKRRREYIAALQQAYVERYDHLSDFFFEALGGLADDNDAGERS